MRSLIVHEKGLGRLSKELIFRLLFAMRGLFYSLQLNKTSKRDFTIEKQLQR